MRKKDPIIKVQSMDTLIDRFAQTLAKDGFYVQRDPSLAAIRVRKDNWAFSISEQLLVGAPSLSDLAYEVHRKYAYDMAGQNMERYITNVLQPQPSTVTHSDHNPPITADYLRKSWDSVVKAHSQPADYTYREPRAGGYPLTKDDVQKMLTDFRKSIVEDVMQQVCDEIAKLTDAIERSRT